MFEKCNLSTVKTMDEKENIKKNLSQFHTCKVNDIRCGHRVVKERDKLDSKPIIKSIV